MLTLGIGLLALGAYIYIDRKFPRPERQVAELFDLPFAVTKGVSVIAPKPEVENRKNEVFYKFKCRIIPDKALMADGEILSMNVPDSYRIKQFIVGVNPADNSVNWVHIGNDQYHCDKHETSKCLYLKHLYKEEISYEFLYKLIDLFETYNMDTPLRIDHWNDSNFERLNRNLISELKAA